MKAPRYDAEGLRVEKGVRDRYKATGSKIKTGTALVISVTAGTTSVAVLHAVAEIVKAVLR